MKQGLVSKVMKLENRASKLGVNSENWALEYLKKSSYQNIQEKNERLRVMYENGHCPDWARKQNGEPVLLYFDYESEDYQRYLKARATYIQENYPDLKSYLKREKHWRKTVFEPQRKKWLKSLKKAKEKLHETTKA